jgi:hypothetical protein
MAAIAARTIRGQLADIVSTDEEYDAAVHGIQNTNLSDEAKAESLIHLKKHYGKTQD